MINEELFLKAANEGNTVEMQRLIGAGIDPSVRKNLAIRGAASSNQPAAVALLLTDQRVDPTTYHNAAARLATQFGYIEVLEVLLKDPRVDAVEFGIDKAAQKSDLDTLQCIMHYRPEKAAYLQQNHRGLYDVIKLRFQQQLCLGQYYYQMTSQRGLVDLMAKYTPGYNAGHTFQQGAEITGFPRLIKTPSAEELTQIEESERKILRERRT